MDGRSVLRNLRLANELATGSRAHRRELNAAGWQRFESCCRYELFMALVKEIVSVKVFAA